MNSQRNASPRYSYQVICLNGSNQLTGKYQLYISEIGQQGEIIQRVRWHFRTIKGLLSFLKKHFPDSELLHQDISRCIQFQVAPQRLVSIPTDPTSLAKIAVLEPDMPSQLHPDRVFSSTLANQVTVSCG